MPVPIFVADHGQPNIKILAEENIGIKFGYKKRKAQVQTPVHISSWSHPLDSRKS